MYILDFSKKQTFQLSNDAFFYIVEGEEPCDEDNREEALEILESFPNGFELAGEPIYVEGPEGLIQATFVPYIEEQKFEAEGIYKLSKIWQFEYKWLIPYEAVSVWFRNTKTGEVRKCEDLAVNYDSEGRPYVITMDKCRFYLE